MPISLLFATALLAVFLFESIKMWMLSGTFAQVDVPIFPRFRRSPESFAWPIGNFFDDARNSILAQGFTEKALLKMGFNQYFAIYSPVFLSKDQCSRLQIIFNSLRLGRPFLSCVLTSFASDGTPIVTNNLRAICASFYPKSWDVKRRSMVSIEKLLKTHASRIAGKELLKIDETNLLETINSENHQIELLNCDAGLCEKLRWNNNITLTFHGRYVLWCDLLTYSYFGK
jgi:hypothetical protein